MFRRVSKICKLSKEALLYDSKLYIIKAMLAIATGYVIGKSVPIARIDMISVLLGVMYNLEPINTLGIRGGIDQLLASTLGAACTGLLIFLFGINVFTIAIAMGLTLYVSLKINWRMVSPVAIFTCIYMSQFVQLDALGNPSIWLTFRLRVVALGLGILIAVIFNYATSFFYYRKLASKRLEFAKIQLLSGMEYIEDQLETPEGSLGRDYINVFPGIFNDIDSVYRTIETMLKESRYSVNLLKPDKLRSMLKLLQHFRDVNHIVYDINFDLCRNKECFQYRNEILTELGDFKRTLKAIDFSFKKSLPGRTRVLSTANELTEEIQTKNEEIMSRIEMNLQLLREYRECIITQVEKLKVQE